MITVIDIAWVAALLEGEGSFCLNKTTPTIQFGSSDLDILLRLKRFICPKGKITTQAGGYQGRTKDFYLISSYASLAVQWMMTIFPLMGIRRQEKIQKILVYWKQHTRYQSKNYAIGQKLRFADTKEKQAEILKEVLDRLYDA